MAGIYPNWDFFFNYLGPEALDALIRSIPLSSFQSALDLGCGFGGPAIYLAQISNMSILGVERVTSIYNFTLANVRSRGLSKRIHLVLGDLYLIPQSDNSYDIIYGIDSFLLVKSEHTFKALIKRCWRMLRPEGYFFFTFLCVGPQFRFGSDEHRFLNLALPTLLQSDAIKLILLEERWSKEWISDITLSAIGYTKSFFKQLLLGLASLKNQDLWEKVSDIENTGVMFYLKTGVLSYWVFIAQK